MSINLDKIKEELTNNYSERGLINMIKIHGKTNSAGYDGVRAFIVNILKEASKGKYTDE